MSRSEGHTCRASAAAALFLVPLIVAACSVLPSDRVLPSDGRAEKTLTTSSSSRPPRATICAEPEQVEQRVRDVIDAYNVGDVATVDALFAPEGKFEWYSENGLREGAAARDRSTLVQYVAQRHADGDVLTLAKVEPGLGGNFAFYVDRGKGREIISKGALDCATGLVFVWSLGSDPGP